MPTLASVPQRQRVTRMNTDAAVHSPTPTTDAVGAYREQLRLLRAVSVRALAGVDPDTQPVYVAVTVISMVVAQL